MVDYSNGFEDSFEKSTSFEKLLTLVLIAKKLSGESDLCTEDCITPRHSTDDGEISHACMDKTFVSIIDACVVFTEYTSLFELRSPVEDLDTELKLEDCKGAPIKAKVTSFTFENQRLERETIEDFEDRTETSETKVYSKTSIEYQSTIIKCMRSLCRYIRYLLEQVETDSKEFARILNDFSAQLTYELLIGLNNGEIGTFSHISPGGIVIEGEMVPVSNIKSRKARVLADGIITLEDANIKQSTLITDDEFKALQAFTQALSDPNTDEEELESFLDTPSEVHLDVDSTVRDFMINAPSGNEFDAWGQLRTLTINPNEWQTSYFSISKDINDEVEIIAYPRGDNSPLSQIEVILFILDLLE